MLIPQGDNAVNAPQQLGQCRTFVSRQKAAAQGEGGIGGGIDRTDGEDANGMHGFYTVRHTRSRQRRKERKSRDDGQCPPRQQLGKTDMP